ncbi:MAG TPA: hypothetical protein VFW03_05455 [Gemmatimonadaceae bacterium]|nr:hypothetical protein [Gemmatimonadaceae bacterium]
MKPTPSTSHVGAAESAGAVSEARSGLINLGWDRAIAHAAVERAAAELPADATVERLVFAALRHCPAPVRACDGPGPTTM